MQKQTKWEKGQYHYEIDCYACVLCGHEDIYRYRVEGSPDPNLYGYAKLHYIETACHGHFM